ncbi:MAG: class I SAM-dependent methyltransferase [Desulfobacterales bacterium]|jgi:ubiquinone/menaquinone biosynthesis C-methylase UbiE
MDKPMPGLGFALMTLGFKVRDLIRPRMDVLREAGIKSGFYVLDYGCGPGSYLAPLAELVGPSGQIYALDIHPLAIEKVQKAAARKAIANLKTIVSDCKTGLPDSHVDVVLLYDTFHKLRRPGEVLRELYRVLKPNGTLSFSDHHMNEKEIIAGVTTTGLFQLEMRGKKTYSFSKLTIS